MLLHACHLLPDLVNLSVHPVTSVLHFLSHRLLSLKLEVGLHSLVSELDFSRVWCPKAWLVAFLDCLGHMTKPETVPVLLAWLIEELWVAFGVIPNAPNWESTEVRKTLRHTNFAT